MSHWNYRVVKYKGTDEIDNVGYGIHEVFYNDKKEICAFTENAVGVTGEDIEELRTTLAYMKKCLDFPILDEDMTFAKFDGEV